MQPVFTDPISAAASYTTIELIENMFTVSAKEMHTRDSILVMLNGLKHGHDVIDQDALGLVSRVQQPVAPKSVKSTIFGLVMIVGPALLVIGAYWLFSSYFIRP